MSKIININNRIIEDLSLRYDLSIDVNEDAEYVMFVFVTFKVSNSIALNTIVSKIFPSTSAYEYLIYDTDTDDASNEAIQTNVIKNIQNYINTAVGNGVEIIRYSNTSISITPYLLLNVEIIKELNNYVSSTEYKPKVMMNPDYYILETVIPLRIVGSCFYASSDVPNYISNVSFPDDFYTAINITEEEYRTSKLNEIKYKLNQRCLECLDSNSAVCSLPKKFISDILLIDSIDAALLSNNNYILDNIINKFSNIYPHEQCQSKCNLCQ